MNHLIRLSLCALLFVSVFALGCGETETKEKDTGKEKGKSSVEVTDPSQQILGSWKVDADATREGWGDQPRRLLDHLEDRFDFKKDNALKLTARDGAYDVYWEIKDHSGQILNIVFSETKDSQKKIDVKLTFQNVDCVLYQSSEGNFEDDLILKRLE